VSVIACALGIFGTIGSNRGPGVKLSTRNMERATAKYPSFAMAIYYTYKNLIIPSALFQKQGPLEPHPPDFQRELGELAEHLGATKRVFEFF